MSERWAGPFLTVNQAGLGWALGLVILTVMLAVLMPHRRGWWWLLHVALLTTWATVAGVLAASGSRGAWLGLAAALLWLMRVGLLPWRWCVAGALTVTLLIVVLPGSRERFAPGMWEHPSIQHRLALTSGSLAMAWDHPQGMPEAHALVERWYLPPEVQRKYAAPLNDLLAVLTRHGWAGCAAVVAGFAGLLALGGHPGWRHRPVVAAATAGLLVLILAGLAQGHLTTEQVSWPRWVAGGWALVLVLAVARPLAQARWAMRRQIVTWALGTTVVLWAVLMLAMAWTAARHPLATQVIATGLTVMPRADVPRGRVLLAVPDTPAHRQRSLPGWARVAVAAGWSVGLIEEGTPSAVWSWWRPQGLVTVGDAACQAAGWTVPTLLIDPEVLPEVGGPSTVARGRWAPFVVQPDAVATWTAADPRRSVQEYRRHALRPERDGALLTEWLATVPSTASPSRDNERQ